MKVSATVSNYKDHILLLSALSATDSRATVLQSCHEIAQSLRHGDKATHSHTFPRPFRFLFDVHWTVIVRKLIFALVINSAHNDELEAWLLSFTPQNYVGAV